MFCLEKKARIPAISPAAANLPLDTQAAQPALEHLPKSSLLRLYDPATQGNSFSLDGFPALKEDKNWQARLVEFIELKGILGMTTNQTLFRQLLETGVLDGRLRTFHAEGRSPGEIYQVLYNEAAMEAARTFSAIHAQWPWEGRVSQEASALLTELEPLVCEIQRIAGAMKGVGAFTKIPNLKVGPQAVRMAVAGGHVHPNVTLVFSDRHYLDTVEGYLLGLKDLAERGKTLSGVFSVNSLFVSRIDRVVDPMIDERMKLLKGKVAVAHAKKVYAMFEASFLGKKFEDPEELYADSEGGLMLEQIALLHSLYNKLKPLGANPQRLLIASSGVKSDQPYHPLLYVLPLLGPWAANTMPEGTLEIFSRFVAELSDEQTESLRRRNLMEEPLPSIPTGAQPMEKWAQAVLMSSEERHRRGIGQITPDQVLRQAHDAVLQPCNTTLRKICDDLRDKGAQAFTADERGTLQAIEAKLKAL